MTGPSDAPTYDGSQLDDLRRLHDATGNPVFAWMAIDHCLRDRPSGSPYGHLPAWCLDVLAVAAQGIARLAAGVDYDASRLKRPLSESRDVSDPVNKSGRGVVDWGAQAEMVPQALGFVSKGRNQFKNARSSLNKRRAAAHHDQLRHPKIHNMNSKAALAEVAKQLGLPSDDDSRSDVRSAVREGRRLKGEPKSKPTT